MKVRRTILVSIAVVATSLACIAQDRDALDRAREELKLPRGSFSIGLIGTGVFPIVTSDVVGPNAPEGSHQRTTITAGVQGGVEAAWEAHRSLGLILSIRGRLMTTVAFDGEANVHQHVDVVTLPTGTFEVTTDHGVRHVVRRTDMQALVGVEFPKAPIRFIGGVGYMVTGADRIDETFHELSRRAIGSIVVPHDHDDAAASFRVTDRISAIVGAELPMRFKYVEVAVHLTADLGFGTTAEADIPTSSHLIATGVTVAWRF